MIILEVLGLAVIAGLLFMGLRYVLKTIKFTDPFNRK